MADCHAIDRQVLLLESFIHFVSIWYKIREGCKIETRIGQDFLLSSNVIWGRVSIDEGQSIS